MIFQFGHGGQIRLLHRLLPSMRSPPQRLKQGFPAKLGCGPQCLARSLFANITLVEAVFDHTQALTELYEGDVNDTPAPSKQVTKSSYTVRGCRRAAVSRSCPVYRVNLTQLSKVIYRSPSLRALWPTLPQIAPR